MSNYANMLFHCKLLTVRNGADYQLPNNFSTILDTCLSRTAAPFFAIGSAADDFIQIRGLPACGAKFAILDDGVALQIHSPLELITKEHRLNLDAGKKLFFPFSSHGQEFVEFAWKMVFPNQTKVTIRLTPEEEQLAPEALKNLEDRYGAAEKIQEGRTTLVFKTAQGKVLKILRPSLLKSSGVVTRFIHAARKFQALPGNLFLKAHEIVYQRQHGLCYVFMEHFPGETLQNYQARKGTLPLPEAEKIIANVARNLLVLQKYGYCCRNLTPENLLLGADEQVRVTGFFLLKADDTQLTAPGSTMIIPKYTAPEQVLNPSAVDILTDIFSLGGIFYCLLAGEPPFNFNTIHEYSQFLMGASPLTPDDMGNRIPSLPQHQRELLATLLAFEKTLRPTPEQLIQKLAAHNESLQPPQVFWEIVAKIQKRSAKPQKTAAAGTTPVTDDNEVYQGFSATIIAVLANLEKMDTTEAAPDSTTGEESYGHCLEIVSGPPGTRPIKYTFSGRHSSITIGTQGDFKIAHDPQVAARHVQLDVKDDTVTLTDLDAEAGTLLAGNKITQEEIVAGTEFTIGSTVIRYRKSQAAILNSKQEELSDADIGEVEELRIISLEPEADAPASALDNLAQTQKRLQEMYQQLGQPKATGQLPTDQPPQPEVVETPSAAGSQEPVWKSTQAAITSQKSSRLPLLWMTLALLVATAVITGLGIAGGWYVRKHWLATPAANNLPIPTVAMAKAGSISKTPVTTVRSEPAAPTDVEKELQAAQRVLWGKYWLSRQEYEALAAKWSPGIKPLSNSFTPVGVQIRYSQDEGKPTVYAQGELSPQLLPAGFTLSLQAQLANHQKTPIGGPGKNITLEAGQLWKTDFPDLSEKLPPGHYYLRLELAPHLQSEFLRDFLSLQSNQSWWLEFTVGSPQESEQYYRTQIDEVQKILQDADDLYRAMKRLSRQKPGVIQKEWLAWSPRTAQKLAALSQKIAERQGRRLAASLLKPVDDRLLLLAPSLAAFGNVLQAIAQKPQNPKLARDIFERQRAWELLYDETRLILEKQMLAALPRSPSKALDQK